MMWPQQNKSQLNHVDIVWGVLYFAMVNVQYTVYIIDIFQEDIYKNVTLIVQTF